MKQMNARKATPQSASVVALTCVLLMVCVTPACTIASRHKSTPIPLTRFRPDSSVPRAFSYYSGFTKREQRVITSQQEWIELWRYIGNGAPSEADETPPYDVNFDREIVIFAAMGSSPNGGNIVIRNAVLKSGRIIVTIGETTPATTCNGNSVSTEPMDIAKLSRTNRPIKFKLVKEEIPCR